MNQMQGRLGEEFDVSPVFTRKYIVGMRFAYENKAKM